MATFQATVNDDTTYTFALQGSNVYFGGTLIVSNGLLVATDRLGSVRANNNGETFSYYSYGLERTSTADHREKFGTYVRDGMGAGVEQDYADQRYYDASSGTFWSPDPAGIKAADPTDPSSWNIYAYVEGDPINNYDPFGQFLCNPDYCNPVSGSLPGGGAHFPSPIQGKDGPPMPAYFDAWTILSADCQNGLENALGNNIGGDVTALGRAEAAEGVLQAAANAKGVDWEMLAAIGIYESGFIPKNENDGSGVAVGIFQINNGGAAAMQLPSAADLAAGILASNLQTISRALPNLSPELLLQALADSWNAGAQGVIERLNSGESPDWHTSPLYQNGKPTGQYRGGGTGQYGSDILKLMDCF